MNLFDEIDRIEIYKYLLLKKKKVVFIENDYESNNLEYECKYIIDKDICEIFWVVVMSSSKYIKQNRSCETWKRCLRVMSSSKYIKPKIKFSFY